MPLIHDDKMNLPITVRKINNLYKLRRLQIRLVSYRHVPNKRTIQIARLHLNIVKAMPVTLIIWYLINNEFLVSTMHLSILINQYV
jgi:hypothetical protein